MRIFQGFDNLPAFVHPVVTMGSFDGVHKGHRKLIGRLRAVARRVRGESVVITFDPHPRTVLGNRGEPVQLLNTPDEKAMLLSSLGVDNLIVAPFTEAFSRIAPYDFLRGYLAGRLEMKHLVLGYDHHFGRNHAGDFDYLHALQAEFGFKLHRLPEQSAGKERRKVSSTVIRHLVREGQMDMLPEYLGFPYFAAIRGESSPDPLKLMPRAGKYRVTLHGPDILPGEETRLFPEPVVAEILPDGRVNAGGLPVQAEEFILRFRTAQEDRYDDLRRILDPAAMTSGEVWTVYG